MGNGGYGHYKNLVFHSKIKKCKQFVPAAGFGTFGVFSRSGDLQADLLGCLGGEAPKEKGKLHVAREYIFYHGHNIHAI